MKTWKVINVPVFMLAAMMAMTSGAWADRTVAETTSDATITASIKTRLLADTRTDGLKIDVDTTSGVVYLKGNVDSKDEVTAAEAIAKKVEGVKSVKNELHVGKN
ncbi:MAG: BON domain-containing protein [Nitrospiria bacterium]